MRPPSNLSRLQADEEGILSEEGKPPQTYHLERATLGIFSMLHAQAILAGRSCLQMAIQILIRLLSFPITCGKDDTEDSPILLVELSESAENLPQS